MPELLFDKQGNVGIITLNRPERLNALTFAMAKDLISYFQDAEQDDSIRAILITGSGRAFCAGADLSGAAAERPDALTPMGMKVSVIVYERVFFLMYTMEKPIVNAINGLAAGAGCSIALAGDIMVAAQSATFIEVFARRGLVPDAGSAFLLPRLVGLARAKEIAYFAEDIPAKRAQEIGLINKVVPPEKLMEEAMAYAQRLAAGPTRAIGMMKKLLNRSFELDIQTVLEFESAFQAIAVSTEDAREGVTSFLEKRPPRFTGR